MAIDLSHHLSKEAKARIKNPMKAMAKLAMATKGCISLANGDPHYSLCALSQVDFYVPSLEEEDIVGKWRDKTLTPKVLSVSGASPASLDLKVAMQYGAGAGTRELREILENLNRHIHKTVPYNCVTLHLGNADAASRCFRLFGDPEDSFLCEEFSFPGITHAPLAHSIRWVPIKVDGQGIVPEDMERILSAWDEEKEGRRPHVLYTIPCGQNPTGSTLSLERRHKIYELACKWDIIVLEDDPYFFLQFTEATVDKKGDVAPSTFLDGLLPSFASMDVEGRVIRFDTFSKVIAPGMRLGWFTSSAFFRPYIEKLTDSSMQHPHGMGQLYIAELLSTPPNGWGFDGFIRWCEGLAKEYERKRDVFLHLLKIGFGSDWGVIVSADTPVAGMFICLQVAVNKLEKFTISHTASGPKTNACEIMNELFHLLLQNGVVVMPAATFAIEGKGSDEEEHILDRSNYFRLTFAGADETINKGVGIIVPTIKAFFGRPGLQSVEGLANVSVQ